MANITPRSRSGYLPSLDGWRAIAILAVVAVHDHTYLLFGYSLRSLQNYGSLGVVLFFAISGVLIPWRILEEEALTGRFHLKLFYVRRLFRIQPAALVYLGVIAALAVAGLVEISWRHWSGALLMYENFLYRDDVANWTYGYFIGHFWTLAVEEHFYLLISLALFFIRGRRLRTFLLALALVKAAQFVLQHRVPAPLLRRTYWQVQVLLWPTTAVIALRRPAVRAWAERWMQPVSIFGLTAILGAMAYRRSPNFLLNVLEYSFTLWVIATMVHPASWSTRLLEWRPLRFLGRISYSLYLWHVLFFSADSLAPVHSHVLAVLSGPRLKYVSALCAALVSYYLIEKPFIRLGHRLAPPATAGHPDLRDEPTLAGDPARALPSI